MVQSQTYVKIIDNTGVKQILCIRILTNNANAKIGGIIIGTVKKVIPKSTIKKSDIVRVILVRVRKVIHRINGTHISFSDNAGIIVTKDNNPLGTRIFGPIAKEIRVNGFSKVVSLASTIL